MENTIRIRTTPNGGDKYIKTKLEQDFDFIEVLSLKISQEEVYKKFCSDYGVVVGRVSINNGFGVPNAKVSIFIPLTDEDKLNPEIKGLYPYETVTDKDKDGVRYNLLPKESDVIDDCYTPVGTFPAKREILDNEIVSEVYCKYYKFTTTTNFAGDFMIFGLPIGTYTVHVDADISNIGAASQRPYDLIDQGTPVKLFDSPTKFKASKNLDTLVQIKSANSGVNVQPFWGDSDNCEVGINRLDFDLNYTIRPSAIFMGSLFGDSGKDSVNMMCRPRKDMGQICDVMTSEGTIEIIRKTSEGVIEELNIEGGRLIDNNGTWAFQIPMNLDYVVTNEFGKLIPSDDPNKGVPTRARVRFRIGMDESGGEARLRTRAKYLIPHNPSNTTEVDFNFGPDTKDSSFVDLYWNKIYSVKSFISRYQKLRRAQINHGVNSRNAIQIKNVDNCVGDKTPFPYNRIHTEKNPLFTVICSLLAIMVFIVSLINTTVINVINAFIIFVDGILLVICGLIYGIGRFVCAFKRKRNKEECWDKFCIGKFTGGRRGCNCRRIIPLIGCIVFQCSASDNEETYAPGCGSGGLGFQGLEEKNERPDHFSGIGGLNSCWDDGNESQHTGHDTTGAGYTDCVAIGLAEKLGMFEFDFYNDWINGTLYFFLLKYKKRIKGRERFCEYECRDFAGGVDGNENGRPDNPCKDAILLDSCVTYANDVQTSVLIRNGLISKKDDELYYPPITKIGDYRFFATDIINLGGVFDCDWQGIPKLQKYLIPTSYKKPQLITEKEDNDEIVYCGMGATGNAGGNFGVFFSISCAGVDVIENNCANIRKICEIGVDLPENTGSTLDCSIGIDEIYDATDPQDDANSISRYIRNVFYGLNINGPSSTSYVTHSIINNIAFGTSVNANNEIGEEFQQNGVAYNQFRDFRPTTHDYSNPQSDFRQPWGNSYFFYFGLLPGKTALDKMNAKYFTKCDRLFPDEFIIDVSSTNTTTNTSSDGTITFTFFGDNGPFYYEITSLNFQTITGSSYAYVVNQLINLPAQTYTITATNTLGSIVIKDILINTPLELACDTSITQQASTYTSNDMITTTTISNGTPPYSIEVRNISGSYNNTSPIGANTLINPFILTGLGVDTYDFIVTDSNGNTCIQTITGTSSTQPLSVSLDDNPRYSPNPQNISCGRSGSFVLKITGGTPPYTISTIGYAPDGVTPNGYVGNTLIQGGLTTSNGLATGIYKTTVTDSSITTQVSILDTEITESTNYPTIEFVGSNFNQTCNPSTIINFKIINGVGPYSASVIGDGFEFIPYPQTFVDNIGTKSFTILEPFENLTFTLIDANGCETNNLDISESEINRASASPLTTTITYSLGTLSTTTTNGVPPYIYTWYKENTDGTFIEIPSVITPTYTPSPAVGTFYVTVLDNNGCQAESNNIIIP